MATSEGGGGEGSAYPQLEKKQHNWLNEERSQAHTRRIGLTGYIEMLQFVITLAPRYGSSSFYFDPVFEPLIFQRSKRNIRTYTFKSCIYSATTFQGCWMNYSIIEQIKW